MGCLHTEKTRYSRFLGLDAIGPSAQLGIAAEGPQPVRPHSPLRLNCWHAKRLEYSDDGREFPFAMHRFKHMYKSHGRCNGECRRMMQSTNIDMFPCQRSGGT